MRIEQEFIENFQTDLENTFRNYEYEVTTKSLRKMIEKQVYFGAKKSFQYMHSFCSS